MATPAQILANQANALHSTGPKTDAGKAASSRNHTTHGLTLGVLTLDPADAPRFHQFEADLRAEMNPVGALELEAFQQFIDAAARLDKIRTLLAALFHQHAEEPLCVPEAAQQIRQLNRYRAAAEMLLYRSLATLRELQTTRLFREFHVTPEEQTVLPPLVNPGVKMLCDGQWLGHNDRELLYHLFGPETFTSRLPVSP